MPVHPTVIITSCRPGAEADPVMGVLDRSRELGRALALCNLPMVVVRSAGEHPPALPHEAASHSVCTFEPRSPNPLDQHTEALIEGVLLSARSPGWVWVPADTPMLRCATVCAVASELRHASLVHAEHAHSAGIPLGIGPELYSELIHLEGYADLLKLRARYPALAVPTADPGVLMSEVGRMRVPALPALPTLGHPSPHALPHSGRSWR